MRRPLALIGVRSPIEARVFQGIAVLALIVAVVYWFVSYEAAGTLLLTGFAVASGIIGLLLANAGNDWRTTAAGRPQPDPDRPLLDERGRIPSPTLAPFAVGIGAAVALLSLVFGPAPLLVGVLPLAWGAADWLRRASAELDAQEPRAGASSGAATRRDARVTR
jgi:Cytochrome c oxidase subunit IV